MREVNKILILFKFLKRLVVVARLCRPGGDALPWFWKRSDRKNGH
jgi:hypothetical protein